MSTDTYETYIRPLEMGPAMDYEQLRIDVDIAQNAIRRVAGFITDARDYTYLKKQGSVDTIEADLKAAAASIIDALEFIGIEKVKNGGAA